PVHLGQDQPHVQGPPQFNPQQQQQQGLHNIAAQGHRTQSTVAASNENTVGYDETEDDGLWIHFVVKVGWSDRKNTLEKAAS
ncbi:hypothetical protein FBU30_004594, partial [Linnemannia zychae]